MWCVEAHAERVLSLQTCLQNCEGLDENQKGFAETIKQWGKRLFEPKEGAIMRPSYKVISCELLYMILSRGIV